MIRGEFEEAGDLSPATLRGDYGELLAGTIESVGIERASDGTDIDRETLAAVRDGKRPTLTLDEAAAVLALDDERPPADAIEAEARDILLMGMSTAVLDVEALAAGIDDAMEPKEIQQKIEGRHPLTLAEYAVLHQYIGSKT